MGCTLCSPGRPFGGLLPWCIACAAAFGQARSRTPDAAVAAARAFAEPATFDDQSIREPRTVAGELLREGSRLNRAASRHLTPEMRKRLARAVAAEDESIAGLEVATALNNLLTAGAGEGNGETPAARYGAFGAAAPEWLPRTPPALVYRGRQQRGWQAVHAFSRGDTEIAVDAVTHRVTSVRYPFGTTRRPASAAALEPAGRRWLAAHGIDLTGWLLERATVLDHGASVEAQFEWRHVDDGVELPGLLSLTLNVDGVPTSMHHIDRPLEVEVEPKVTWDEAVATARRELGRPTAEARSRRLSVWFDEAGRQRLMWRFGLRSVGYQAVVEVNAHTGELVHAATPSACGDCEDQVARFVLDLRSLRRVELLSCPGPELDWFNVGSVAQARPLSLFDRGSPRLIAARDALAASVKPMAGKPGSTTGWYLALHTASEPAVYYARFDWAGGLLIDDRLAGAAKPAPDAAWPPTGAEPVDLFARLPEDLTRALFEGAGLDWATRPGKDAPPQPAAVLEPVRPQPAKRPLAWLLALAGVVIAAAGTLALRLRRRV